MGYRHNVNSKVPVQIITGKNKKNSSAKNRGRLEGEKVINDNLLEKIWTWNVIFSE